STRCAMRIFSWLKQVFIGSRDDQLILPPGLTFFEMMEIGLEELRASHPVTGCSPQDIREIEETLSIVLPRTYQRFLEVAGRDAGPFLLGSHYWFPAILEMRDWAKELLSDNGASFDLRPADFVFYVHQGYQFAYFPTDPPVEDPPVFYYYDGHGKPWL